MRTIILHGELADRFGSEHRFEVKSAAEAIRALKANYRGFAPYMGNAHHDNIGFHIKVGSTSVQNYEEVSYPAPAQADIHIIPAVFGSGGTFTRVLIGAVLVVGGILVSGASFGAAAPIGQAMIGIGAGLILGGVASLLTKPPNTPGATGSNEVDRKESAIFSGPVNTSAQGRAIPIGYGRVMLGSAVISGGIETHEKG